MVGGNTILQGGVARVEATPPALERTISTEVSRMSEGPAAVSPNGAGACKHGRMIDVEVIVGGGERATNAALIHRNHIGTRFETDETIDAAASRPRLLDRVAPLG
jgi:hypothetical protein